MRLNTEKRILIIDDTFMVKTMICEPLESAGYTVKVFSTAKEGLGELLIWPAHLVVLDYGIPDMNGLEVMLRVKEMNIDADVMFVSGHDSVEVIKECLQNGADDFVRKPFSVLELVTRVAVRFRMLELRSNLEDAVKKLTDLNDRDDLTGLFNMRYFNNFLAKELSRSNRDGSLVACVMLDLDHFKKVNDHNDHLFGSFVIKEVAKILSQENRSHNCVARYGGDEFIIMLAQTSLKGVQTVCDKIRTQIEKTMFTDGVSKHRQTMSLGYTIVEANVTNDPSELIRAADHSLYRAKEGGRNRVFGKNVQESRNWIESTRQRRKAG